MAFACTPFSHLCDIPRGHFWRRSKLLWSAGANSINAAGQSVLLLRLSTRLSYNCHQVTCVEKLVLMQELCDMYADHHYLLTWQSRRCTVILEEEASSEDVLLAVWQVSNVSEVALCGVYMLLRSRRKTRLDSPVEVYPGS